SPVGPANISKPVLEVSEPSSDDIAAGRRHPSVEILNRGTNGALVIEQHKNFILVRKVTCDYEGGTREDLHQLGLSVHDGFNVCLSLLGAALMEQTNELSQHPAASGNHVLGVHRIGVDVGG